MLVNSKKDMPGIQRRPAGQAGTEDQANGNSPGPSRKYRKTEDEADSGKLRELWSVRNREDYTPILRHAYDVKFLPGSDSVVIAEGFWPYSRLQIFNAQGRSEKAFCEGNVLPFGIAFTKESHIVVTDHRDRTVKFFSREGKQLQSWAESQFDWPNGIAVTDKEQYVVADWSKGVISIHDESGTSVLSFKCFGEGLSDHSCPEYLVIDQHNRIIMTDAYDHSVKVFDDSGEFLLRFGQEAGPGNLQDPRGVCVDAQGDIMVADWGKHTVARYSPDGRWICDVLSSADGITSPWGLDVNIQGLLVLSEQKRISGPALKMFTSDQ